MLNTTHIKELPLIAGSASGKPVRITPAAKPIYDELFRLAQQGNHWARLTVKGINELVTGRLHQNNIFVHPSAKLRNGVEEFVVILPGCKVTVEKLDSDGFKILYFEADLNYFDLQELGQKPGLYSVTSKKNSWDVKLVKDGKIKSEKNRLVAVSERKYKDSKKAAVGCRVSVVKAPFSGGDYRLDNDGFDLHYTPGEKRIGGLVNYRSATAPLKNCALNESAILLAKTMHDARKIPQVGWVSELGGSGVLTQAMKILADQGGSLKGHTVYLVRPSTSPLEALKQAERLELTIGRQFYETGTADMIGNRDHFEVILHRRKTGSYTLLNASADVAALAAKMGFLVPLAGAAGATAVVTSAAPAVMMFLGALSAGTGAVIGVVKFGNGVVKQVAPTTHAKLMRKL